MAQVCNHSYIVGWSSRTSGPWPAWATELVQSQPGQLSETYPQNRVESELGIENICEHFPNEGLGSISGVEGDKENRKVGQEYSAKPALHRLVLECKKH